MEKRVAVQADFTDALYIEQPVFRGRRFSVRPPCCTAVVQDAKPKTVAWAARTKARLK